MVNRIVNRQILHTCRPFPKYNSNRVNRVQDINTQKVWLANRKVKKKVEIKVIAISLENTYMDCMWVSNVNQTINCHIMCSQGEGTSTLHFNTWKPRSNLPPSTRTKVSHHSVRIITVSRDCPRYFDLSPYFSTFRSWVHHSIEHSCRSRLYQGYVLM